MASASTPYFHALAVFACRSNRFYRVYITPEELDFIWAGSGGEGTAGAQAMGRTHGLLGLLLGGLMHRALDPSKGRTERKAELDTRTLDEMLDDHPKNLRATVSGFEEVRISPRSDRHARMYSDHGHQALLHLRHRDHGAYCLGVATVEDVRIALMELPRVFRDLCEVEIETPRGVQPCGCAFCRMS